MISAPDFHIVSPNHGPNGLFLVDGSRVYAINQAVGQALREAADRGEIKSYLEQAGIPIQIGADIEPPPDNKIRTLSLAISQQCNLACTYCYASGGSFGKAPTRMSADVARASVDRLVENLSSGEVGTIAFMGGEPLANRRAVHDIVSYAKNTAAEREIGMQFSITTNGTLITAEDVELFRQNGFCLTLSLDGFGDAHDRNRPYLSGRGSFDRIVKNIAPLLKDPGTAEIHVRTTVCAGPEIDLAETVRKIAALGFTSIGFSPMLSSPNGVGELDAAGLRDLLNQFQACGRLCEEAAIEGKHFPFSNFHTAMKMIHMGASKSYACGAGLGYFAVSAEGELSACHRFVGDDLGRMGNLADGLDVTAVSSWREERHVSAQSPCSRCWARNLCGGGCHHEVLHRGRENCDFIRGWLDYCLGAYLRLLTKAPRYQPR